jgi:hypothetical protein
MLLAWIAGVATGAVAAHRTGRPWTQLGLPADLVVVQRAATRPSRSRSLARSPGSPKAWCHTPQDCRKPC